MSKQLELDFCGPEKYVPFVSEVEEFFNNKQGYFEKYLTNEGHERWCFVKK